LDFGVLGFSASAESSTDSSLLNVDVTNCGGGTEDILARGTDALSPSGTKWQLAPGHLFGAVCPDTNVFKTFLDVILNGAGAVYYLDSVDQVVAPRVGATQSPDVLAQLRMPCSGSDGAGQVMTFSYIFTAML